MRRGEDGQAAILVLAMTFLSFAVAGLAVDGARVLLARRSLQSIADSAATAGASRLEGTSLYSGAHPELDPESAQRRALGLIDGRVDEVSVSASESLVRVEVRTRVAASFLRVVGIRTLPVRAVATAEPVFGEV